MISIRNIKAIVLAGGFGTRLYPLTQAKPKPLVEIAGKAAIGHIFDLLKKYSLKNIAVTTMYKPEMIENWCKNYAPRDLNISFFNENEPLGTAGSFKNAAKNEKCDFLIISGDCICDFNLDEIIDYHYKNNATATLALAKRKAVGEFGTVVCDSQNGGNIRAFIEKPSFNQIFSDSVNCGIYVLSNEILEYIPEGFFDFAKDLFPLLLSKKKKIQGLVLSGYWRDIGSISEYYHTNFEAFSNKIENISLPKSRISENSIIKEGCDISSLAIIGKGTLIESGCCISEAIIQSNVKIGKNCVIEAAIICDGTQISDGTIIRSGSVIGENAKIGKNVLIPSGIKLGANENIPNGSVVMTNRSFKSDGNVIFSDSGIIGDIRDNLSAKCSINIGAAIGSLCEDKTAIFSSDGTAGANLIMNSLISGAVSVGATTKITPDISFNQLPFICTYNQCEMLVYVENFDKNAYKIYIFDRHGLPISRGIQRKIEGYINSEDTFCASFEKILPTEILENTKDSYIRNIAANIESDLSNIKISVSPTESGKLLKDILSKKGAVVDYEKSGKYFIDIDEKSLTVYEENGNSTVIYDKWHIFALILVFLSQKGEKEMIFDASFPKILDTVAQKCGLYVKRYVKCPSNLSQNDEHIRNQAEKYYWQSDLIYAAALFCEALSKTNGEIENLTQKIDNFFISSKTAENIGNASAIMGKLTAFDSNQDDFAEKSGITLIFDSGKCTVYAEGYDKLSLCAEAENEKMADQTLDMTLEKIEGISKNSSYLK